jgi:pyruvate/2-oxoglutarate dehydrogenase complex dihydrolipoamide acyltransferase (E2) component
MVVDTNEDVLPWRRRPARVRPDGFRTPRDRAGHGSTSRRVPFNRVQIRSGAGLLAATATAAHQYAIAEIDYGAIEADRRRRGLRYLPYLARAVILTLTDHPRLNSTFVDGETIVHDGVHLGIAVDLDHEGLVVPVIRDAHRLNVTGLADAIADVAARARSRQLRPDDLVGGTFTITNPGGYGTYWSFPIINVPQVAILSSDGVVKRVVVDDDREALCIRPIGNVGLACDARAIDSTEAASFLSSLQATMTTTTRNGWF